MELGDDSELPLLPLLDWDDASSWSPSLGPKYWLSSSSPCKALLPWVRLDLLLQHRAQPPNPKNSAIAPPAAMPMMTGVVRPPVVFLFSLVGAGDGATAGDLDGAPVVGAVDGVMDGANDGDPDG